MGFIEVDSPDVVIEAVKKAEDSNDLILRLYECHGGTATANVKLNFAHGDVAFVNMLEEQPRKVPAGNSVVQLEFGPYEILTVRVGKA